MAISHSVAILYVYIVIVMYLDHNLGDQDSWSSVPITLPVESEGCKLLSEPRMYFLAYNRIILSFLLYTLICRKKPLFYVDSLVAMLPLDYSYFSYNKHGKMQCYAEKNKRIPRHRQSTYPGHLSAPNNWIEIQKRWRYG